MNIIVLTGSPHKHYKTLARYMKWEDRGMILATGYGIRQSIEKSKYPEMAYELGKNI